MVFVKISLSPRLKLYSTRQRINVLTIASLFLGVSSEKFTRKPQLAGPLAPADRILAVFVQNHMREWQQAVQDRMLTASDETNGNALMTRPKSDEGRDTQASATRGSSSTAGQRTSYRTQQRANSRQTQTFPPVSISWITVT